MSNDSGKCRFGSTRTLSDGHRPVGAYYFRDAHISERICPNTDCVLLLRSTFNVTMVNKIPFSMRKPAYIRHTLNDSNRRKTMHLKEV